MILQCVYCRACARVLVCVCVGAMILQCVCYYLTAVRCYCSVCAAGLFPGLSRVAACNSVLMRVLQCVAVCWSEMIMILQYVCCKVVSEFVVCCRFSNLQCVYCRLDIRVFETDGGYFSKPNKLTLIIVIQKMQVCSLV